MKPASQPKIIFFDIDDTLRPKESGTVPDSTREALRKLKRQGIVTAIATGRSPVILPADIRRLMDETGIEMLVAINGQYVEYRRRPLAAFPIPQADIDAAVAHLAAATLPMRWYRTTASAYPAQAAICTKPCPHCPFPIKQAACRRTRPFTKCWPFTAKTKRRKSKTACRLRCGRRVGTDTAWTFWRETAPKRGA